MASRKLRSVLTAMVALTLCFTSVFAGAPQAQAAEADDAQLFVQLINDLRATEGVGPLQVDTQLTQASLSWATEMKNSGTLKHSQNIAAGLTHDWTVLGENVGVHGVQGSQGVQDLFDAFVASPVHYQNLVDPRFQYIGIGIVYDNSDGKIWTAHRFMAVNSTPPTTQPPTTTTTAPTTTAPSTTRPAPSTTARATTTAVPAPTTTEATSPSDSSTTASTAPPSENRVVEPSNQLAPFEGVNRFTKPELLALLIDGFLQEV